MKAVRYFLFGVFALLVGCSTIQPVYNVHDQAIPSGLTKVQIIRAMKKALTAKRWNIQKADETTVYATISTREHFASIEIPYTTSHYSIIYRDSRNLQAQGDMIHRNYNKWIALLNKQIQTELRLVK